MFGDLRKSSSRDTLEGQFRLLDTKYKETNCTSVNNCLSELMVMLGNA